MEGINCTLQKSCASLPERTRMPSWVFRLMIIFVSVLSGLLAVPNTADAQAIDFRQAANNRNTSQPLGYVEWINSILQQNNSDYNEGMSVPQRVILLNVPATAGNNHTLTMSHQSIKASNNSHAYDFVTSWDQAVAASGVYTTSGVLLNPLNNCGPEPASDPTGYLTACSAASHVLDIIIPDGQYTATLGDDINSRVTAYEGQFGNRTIRIRANAPITAGAINFTGYSGGDLDANYNITWTSSATQVIIEFATHLANSIDPFIPGTSYGAGRGASAITGGPYHVNLYQLDGASLGSQDNQIKGSDLLEIPEPACDIDGPTVTCASDNQVAYIGTVTNGGQNLTYEFVLSNNTANAVAGALPATGPYTQPVQFNVVPGPGGFTANGSVTITFNVYRNGVLISNCQKVLAINPLPPAIGQAVARCDEDPTAAVRATFNLTSLESAINGGTGLPVTWFTNNSLTIPIATPGAYLTGSTVVYAKVTNPVTGCVNSTPVTLTVSPLPTCVLTGPDAACAGQGQLVFSVPAGPSTFNWTVVGGTFTGQGTNEITVTAGNGPTMTVSVNISENNCTNQCSKTVTINPNPECSINGNNNVCPGSTNVYTGPAGMATYAWTISGNGSISGSSTNQTVSVVAGAGCGPYTLTLVITNQAGCSSTCNQTFSATDTQAPSISLAPSSSVVCNPTTAQIAAAFGAATVTDNCATGLTATGTVGAESGTGCIRTVTKSWTVTDACGNTGTNSQTVTFTRDTQGPTITNNPPTSITAECTATFETLPWVAPQFTDACGAVTVVSVVTTPNQQQNSCPATYSRTWTVADACGNTSTFTQTIEVPCCPSACTYTQGAYGSAGGNHCNGDGTSSVSLTQIQNALQNVGGTYVMGSQANNRYWTFVTADAPHIMDEMLPGGGTSQKFGQRAGGGKWSQQNTWSVGPLQVGGQNHGKIKNTLFAQTLTLWLSLNFDATNGARLGSMILSDTIITRASSACGPTGVPTGTPDTFGIPHAVIVYLNSSNVDPYPTTVAGLYRLANDVLGGVVTDIDPNLVANAVDIINNAFDECRFLVGRVPYTGTSGLQVNTPANSDVLKTSPAVEVTAHPNPYTDRIVFTVKSHVSGTGSFDLFGLLGEKVTTLYQGYIEKDAVKTLTYEVPSAQRKTMVYQFRIGNERVTGKVIYPN